MSGGGNVPPHLGPGCYDNHVYNTIVYNLQNRPDSKRGYCLSARTAPRFPPCNKTVTPSPQQYQKDQSKSRIILPGKQPFNSTTQRSDEKEPEVITPGPGTYSLNVVANRKVSWPMRFGRPDWSRIPNLKKTSIQVKLEENKEFVKNRNRVAYFKLYF